MIGACLLRGKHCSIGAGSMVAAGAVVTGDLPANGMYGGVPAKLIRTLDVTPVTAPV